MEREAERAVGNITLVKGGVYIGIVKQYSKFERMCLCLLYLVIFIMIDRNRVGLEEGKRDTCSLLHYSQNFTLQVGPGDQIWILHT